MLGKLMKHEWKSTYRIGLLMVLLTIGITFFGWLAFRAPMWSAVSGENLEYENVALIGTGLLDVLSIFTLLLYVILLVVIVVGTVVYFAVYFYRTMYTDEGYLTHTLPATKHQLLVSKILVSGIWEIIILAMTYLSLAALVLSAVMTVMPDGYTLKEFLEQIGNGFGMLRELLEEEFGLNFLVYKIMLLVVTLIGPFVSMTTIFGAISMGQLFTKHRVMMAIVSYIGISVLNGILGSIVDSIAGSAIFRAGNEDFGAYFDVSMWQGIIVNLLIGVAMYFVSHFVTTKKLNME